MSSHETYLYRTPLLRPGLCFFPNNPAENSARSRASRAATVAAGAGAACSRTVCAAATDARLAGSPCPFHLAAAGAGAIDCSTETDQVCGAAADACTSPTGSAIRACENGAPADACTSPTGSTIRAGENGAATDSCIISAASSENRRARVSNSPSLPAEDGPPADCCYLSTGAPAR